MSARASIFAIMPGATSQAQRKSWLMNSGWPNDSPRQSVRSVTRTESGQTAPGTTVREADEITGKVHRAVHEQAHTGYCFIQVAPYGVTPPPASGIPAA